MLLTGSSKFYAAYSPHPVQVYPEIFTSGTHYFKEMRLNSEMVMDLKTSSNDEEI